MQSLNQIGQFYPILINETVTNEPPLIMEKLCFQKKTANRAKLLILDFIKKNIKVPFIYLKLFLAGKQGGDIGQLISLVPKVLQPRYIIRQKFDCLVSGQYFANFLTLYRRGILENDNISIYPSHFSISLLHNISLSLSLSLSLFFPLYLSVSLTLTLRYKIKSSFIGPQSQFLVSQLIQQEWTG